MLSNEEKKKALEDLYAPLDKHLTFSKAAFGIATNYTYIEELASTCFLTICAPAKVNSLL